MQSLRNSSPPKVVIVGGGIGGLAAALALLHRGIDVDVYEQSAVLKEAGAGVQLGSNGTRVLYALGLQDALSRFQVIPSAREIRQQRLVTQSNSITGPGDSLRMRRDNRENPLRPTNSIGF